ncbi:methyltransferase domain-containing protein [Actinoplanes sp. CA-030573]|uniref:methyltransferase domain-containing protein n=1 Tax=Actinoplanes sp. CA-030573 TaxID=3239898 RepID=UPI003D8EDC0C
MLTATNEEHAASGDEPPPACVVAARLADMQARQANVACYATPAVTDSYLEDPYHAVRRKLAVELVQGAVDHPATPEGALLEIGTGARPMLDDVFTDRPAIAADLSRAALEHQGKGARLCFDATRPFPFADASVAGVVIGELIEHVFAPDELIAEVARVLKPGGVVVLTTPNLATLQDRLRFLFGRAPRQVAPLHPYLRLHIRPFTVRLLRQLLRAYGMEPRAVRSNFVGLQLGRDRWFLSRAMARLFPGLGGSLVISARRRVTID